MMAEYPNVRVLLVESDEISIFVMEKILGKKFHLTVARNGVEALHIAKREIFDAVLIEIRLSHNMDGIEVMEELRKDSIYHLAQIWAFTGVAFGKDEPYFKELGFDRFFKKPINYTELVNLILEALPERVNSIKV